MFISVVIVMLFSYFPQSSVQYADKCCVEAESRDLFVFYTLNSLFGVPRMRVMKIKKNK